MKNIFATLLFCFFLTASWAQQEDQFTQFMYNKMGFNPAYAGSNDAACITAIARAQWIGLEGAPQSQLITFNMPLFNKRVGIGASLQRHTIGITNKFSAEAVYAYRIPVGRGILSLGVQGSVRLLRNDYQDVQGTQPIDIDNAVPPGEQSKYIPNFGAGIYYSSRSFFLGVSAPRLLESNIDFSDLDQLISKEVRHLYIMGGFIFNLGEKVVLQPQTLLKYVEGAPFDADINVNFIFADKVITGLSYRLGGSSNSFGESISLILGWQTSDALHLGVAYDYTLSDLSDYNNGTIEGVVRYCIGGKSEGDEYINPRFF